MLNTFWETDPGVLAVFIDREGWCREAGFSERADWNGDASFAPFDGVMNSRATGRTKVECALAAFITDANILLRLALDLDELAAEPGLSAKDAPGTALAGEAMANGDAYRLRADDCR